MQIKELSKENIKELIDRLDIENINNVEVNNETIEELVTIDTISKRKVLTITVNYNIETEPRDEHYMFRKE